MTNTDTAGEAVTETTDKVVDPKQIYRVPVVKAKGHEAGDTVEINLDDLPDNVYREIIAQGLKVVVNRGMTKVTKETYPKPAELKAAAMEQAVKTAAAMKAGTIRITGAKADKISGKTMTEARRIAKNMVKDEMKAQGIKVSYVDAKDITAAANALILADPSIIEQAKTNLEAQEAKASAVASKINLKAMLPVNEKKKAKIEKEKADAKAQFSKTQAGKTAVRAKPAPAKV